MDFILKQKILHGLELIAFLTLLFAMSSFSLTLLPCWQTQRKQITIPLGMLGFTCGVDLMRLKLAMTLASFIPIGLIQYEFIVHVNDAAFNYPSPTNPELNQLSTVINLAHSNSLLVHLTLFDWWCDCYTDFIGSKQWASTIIGPYAGDPRIGSIYLF